APITRGRTGFLALMVPELGIPYFAELAALVIVAAQARDWNVLIEQTRGTRDRERATLASLGPHLIDGAIISPEALHVDDLTAHHPGVFCFNDVLAVGALRAAAEQGLPGARRPGRR